MDWVLLIVVTTVPMQMNGEVPPVQRPIGTDPPQASVRIDRTIEGFSTEQLCVIARDGIRQMKFNLPERTQVAYNGVCLRRK